MYVRPNQQHAPSVMRRAFTDAFFEYSSGPVAALVEKSLGSRRGWVKMFNKRKEHGKG